MFMIVPGNTSGFPLVNRKGQRKGRMHFLGLAQMLITVSVLDPDPEKNEP